MKEQNEVTMAKSKILIIKLSLPSSFWRKLKVVLFVILP